MFFNAALLAQQPCDQAQERAEQQAARKRKMKAAAAFLPGQVAWKVPKVFEKAESAGFPQNGTDSCCQGAEHH